MEEKFLQIDGNQIRYLESGKAEQTLILIHGLGGSAERWDQTIPVFADTFRVIALDLVGFGYSDKPLVDYTPEFFSDFLGHFFAKVNAKHPILIGSSLGGQIAVEYASSYQDRLEKLVLVSPAGMMKQSTPALDAYIMAALYPNTQNAKSAFEAMDGSGRAIPDRIINGFVERMRLPNAKLAFMSTLLGLKNSQIITSKLEKISIPTLIIWGSNDPVIPIIYAHDFVSTLPNCKFLKMNECGHTPYVQKPHAFVSHVLEFIDT